MFYIYLFCCVLNQFAKKVSNFVFAIYYLPFISLLLPKQHKQHKNYEKTLSISRLEQKLDVKHKLDVISVKRSPDRQKTNDNVQQNYLD